MSKNKSQYKMNKFNKLYPLNKMNRTINQKQKFLNKLYNLNKPKIINKNKKIKMIKIKKRKINKETPVKNMSRSPLQRKQMSLNK